MKKRGKKKKGKIITKKKSNKKIKKIIKKGLEKLKKKIRNPSGINNFDKFIEGGFKQDSVNLVVGSSGSGKTILATQFLMEGLKKKENVLYITFEEKKDGFYRNMGRFGWDLQKYESKKKFFFLEYTPEKVRTMLEEGGGSIEAIVIKHKIKRLVIDSFTSFALLFENELLRREAAIALFSMIRKWQCTSLLTLEDEDITMRDSLSASIEFEADSIILLYFLRDKKTRKRYIEVLKMRGTKHSTAIHGFEIGEKGIKVQDRVLIDKIKK